MKSHILTDSSKIVDIKMHKEVDKKHNAVMNVWFDITYEENRTDGSVYRYILTGLESPFLPYCHVETEVDNPLYSMFSSDDIHHMPRPVHTLETKGGARIRDGFKIVYIKEADPIDVTMEEIEAKFGAKVRIVKEKK